MPVKKKKATKKVKREIKRAVEELPGLMVEHVKFQELEKPQDLPKLPAPTHYEEIETESLQELSYNNSALRQKKVWLWAGVIIFSIIIFTMWAWNMRVIFRDSIMDKKQPSITETAKKTWQETMTPSLAETTNQPTAPENLDNLKKQIKNNIISIFYAKQASTTASSTN